MIGLLHAEGLNMGFTDFIIKISNAKFSRRFQYEPYIIKSVEYINPEKEDKLLVIFKETDYLQSLMMQYVKHENYFSFELKQKIDINAKIDKVVLFFSLYELSKNHIETIKKWLKKGGSIYSITYLKDSKFFELTLKLIDREESDKLDTENNILEKEGFVTTDKADLSKHHVSIKKYKEGK
jgi:hypothetical protein